MKLETRVLILKYKPQHNTLKSISSGCRWETVTQHWGHTFIHFLLLIILKMEQVRGVWGDGPVWTPQRCVCVSKPFQNFSIDTWRYYWQHCQRLANTQKWKLMGKSQMKKKWKPRLVNNEPEITWIWDLTYIHLFWVYVTVSSQWHLIMT